MRKKNFFNFMAIVTKKTSYDINAEGETLLYKRLGLIQA